MPKMVSPPENWRPKTPASEATIELLLSDSPMQLPESYLDLLRVSNGGCAELSVSPWTIDFWAAENIKRLNHEYGVDEGAPNFLAFGSNLGEEVLAFDKRDGARSGVYMLPWYAPVEAYAFKVADSFEGLLAAIKGTFEQPYQSRTPARDRRVWEKDGKEMLRVKAGEFLYGEDGRKVSLPEFWIDKTPVTNAEFARFVSANGYETTAEQTGIGCANTGDKWEDVQGADWRHPGGPETDIRGKADHPVVQVSWDDAVAYARWAGKRLPKRQPAA
jgi:hypothetical protein